MRVRPAVAATILTGPPATRKNDARAVAKLMEGKAESDLWRYHGPDRRRACWGVN